MTLRPRFLASFLMACFLFSTLLTPLRARSGSFQKLVGNVKPGPIRTMKPLVVPYITWGGDMATFYANGGLNTKPGTLYARQGLNLKLVPGDDFPAQVRDYISGRSPFLRGTFRMIGMASEVIGSHPRTKGVVVLQLTWSAGDHMVVRPEIHTINDLKGKTVILQQGGPHVGMFDDILKSARLTWEDVHVLWAKELTGPGGAAERFRKDPSVAACFVISPDMIGLTGGLRSTGSGAEGTILGARVLVSTAELSRSIADVYVVRKDFYEQHKNLVTRFVAGYMKASEEVLELKKDYESKGSRRYMQLLKMSQNIFGKDVLPTLEEDAHGLLSDCTFVGYPGNVAFFQKKRNLTGFQAFEKSALDLAVGQGYASVRAGLFPSGLNYQSPLFKGYLSKTKLSSGGERFQSEAVLSELKGLSSGEIDNRTILSFNIDFASNQTDFSAQRYGVEFQRVVELSNKYGNAIVAVRGHSDPTKTLIETVRAGLKKGVLRRTGSGRNKRYSLRGRPLNLSNTEALIRYIEAGDFDGVSEYHPREVMKAAQNLSFKRAAAVRRAIMQYTRSKGFVIDPSQIQPVGVGIKEPRVPQPRSIEDARKNMRVEFLLMRVDAEVSPTSDFDY
jgi:outer membrane protein OmpA-like peptidoglycan-associated protein